jgi:hypothetical protein
MIIAPLWGSRNFPADIFRSLTGEPTPYTREKQKIIQHAQRAQKIIAENGRKRKKSKIYKKFRKIQTVLPGENPLY